MGKPERGLMKVIASAAAKGGVGKTSIAVNLATLAARAGFRTLLWDLDPQAASTHCLRLAVTMNGGAAKMLGGNRDLDAFVRASFIERLDVVPADSTLRSAEAVLAERRWPDRAIRKLLRPLAGDYDVVILDCPPGLGLLAEATFGAADLVLTPIVPAPLAIRGLEQTIEFFEANDVDAELLAVLSMVDRRKVLHRQVIGRVEESEHFADAVIPLSDAVERMGLEQMPSVLASPRSLSTTELSNLWTEICELLDLN